MKDRFKVVIPARYASSRLPGKPLVPIAGKPMILHVCDRAKESQAEEIVVATDDSRIFKAVSDYGFTAIMTRDDHTNGTERIAEVCSRLGWQSSDIVVNLQGDEPSVPSELIRTLALGLLSQQAANIATLATPVIELEQIFNPNHVKVVLDQFGYALYFSRAAIPWDRDNFHQHEQFKSSRFEYLRHIGMYAYSVDFLERYVAWSTSVLEQVESLEQLRILWYGERIFVRIIDQEPEPGVDTLNDLRRVEQNFTNKTE